MKRCQYKLYFDLVEPSLINLSPSTVVISLLPQEDLPLLGSGALGSAGRGREAILLYHIPVDLGLGGLAVSLPPRGPVIPFIRSRKEIGLRLASVVSMAALAILISLFALISEIQRGLKPTG